MKLTMNCAVLERTADGKPAGRCYFHLGGKDICPRHGDVQVAQEHYRMTGSLTDEREAVCVRWGGE